MANKRDYYEVLGVDKSASDEAIKRAYRQAAKETHPDLHPDDPTAEVRFKEVNEAYEILSDKEKRARYDQFGHAGVDPSAGAGGFGGGGFDFGGFGDLGDLLNSFFGGGFSQGSTRSSGSASASRAPRRGSDVRESITLSFEDAAKGCTKEIEYRRIEDCSNCHGTGAKPGTKPKTCPTCGGNGSVRVQQRTMLGVIETRRVCDTCGGSGKTVEQRCPKCSGVGKVRVGRKYTVTIPAGVDNGQTVNIRGEGSAGMNGGPNGDLYLDISVRPHHFFDRKGFDLYCKVPLTFAQAALGAEISVMTLDGTQKVKVPAGTQPGDKHTLKNKGVSRLNSHGKGDQIIEYTIIVPRKLNDAQRKLIRSMDSALPKDVAEPSSSDYSDEYPEKSYKNGNNDDSLL